MSSSNSKQLDPTVPPEESFAGTKRKRGRGPSKGQNTEKKIANTGEKLNIEFDALTWSAVGDNTGAWATELGQIVRQIAPMKIKTWKEVEPHEKKEMVNKMKQKFVFDEVKHPKIVESIDLSVSKLWTNFRSKLHAYFKENGGNTDLEAMKAKRHKDIEDQSVWVWLCDHWSTEEFKEKSRINSENRCKKLFLSRQGSKKMVAHRHSRKTFPGAIEHFRNMHWTMEQGWTNEEAEKRYNEMVGMLSEQSTEDGDSSTALTEDQINDQVRGTRSGYIKGMGRLPRGDSKKLKSSTSASSETSVQGQSQLEQEVEYWKNRITILTKFIMSKFPDFPAEESRDPPHDDHPPSRFFLLLKFH